MLIKCAECQTEVSDKAAVCPKCACPLCPITQSWKGMVVVSALVSVISLVFFMYGFPAWLPTLEISGFLLAVAVFLKWWRS